MRALRHAGMQCPPGGSWLLARTSRWPIVGGRHQEGRCDGGGVETQHGLEHQRRAHGAARSPDARTRTSAPGGGPAWPLALVLAASAVCASNCRCSARRLAMDAGTYRVDQFAARDHEQPSLRVVGNAALPASRPRPRRRLRTRRPRPQPRRACGRTGKRPACRSCGGRALAGPRLAAASVLRLPSPATRREDAARNHGCRIKSGMTMLLRRFTPRRYSAPAIRPAGRISARP